MGNFLFLDIDTQNDFMNEDGALYVPGAKNIKKNLRDLTFHCCNHSIPIVATVDTHKDDDPEFNRFPPHCMANTDGHKKIPETNMVFCNCIKSKLGSELSNFIVEPVCNYIFEKATCDIWDKELGQPDNLTKILVLNSIDSVVVSGVATNFCVIAAVKGLINEMGHILDKVYVVEDATAGIFISNEDNHETAIKEMNKMGASIIKTDLVCDL